MIDDLRFFVRLVAAGNLSEAARRLYSSPPAMSRRLVALEQRLGVKLIERSSRRFTMTEEGVFLHERALNILAEVDEIEAELSTKGKSPAGLIRIGAPMEIGRRRIAPLVGEFQKRFPKIKCELVLSDAGLEVMHDELDIAFRTMAPNEQDVVALTMIKSHRAACASPEYLARHGEPRVPQDLIQHDCLCLVRGRMVFDRWRFLRAGKPIDVKVHGSLASTSGEVIHAWALEGLGIAYKVKWDIEDDLRDGRLIECLTEYAWKPACLHGVYQARQTQPERLQAFLKYMRASFKADLALSGEEPKRSAKAARTGKHG